MPTSNVFPLSCIRAALTLRRVSLRQIARKHGASYHSCYALLAGTRPGRPAEVRRAVREMFVIARRVLGPTHAAILVVKKALHDAAPLTAPASASAALRSRRATRATRPVRRIDLHPFTARRPTPRCRSQPLQKI